MEMTDPISRIQMILHTVEGDTLAVLLIKNVINRCKDFIPDLEAAEETREAEHRRFHESEESRKLTECAGSLARLSYDTLIDSIKAVNHYLFRNFGNFIPQGGIYSEDPGHLTDSSRRSEIGRWAREVALAFPSNGKK
jgi:hypothetical protein